MTMLQKVVTYVSENPEATNEQIANDLGISEGYAKVVISKCKSKGVIKVKNIGNKRTIEVIGNVTSNFKEDVLIELLSKLTAIDFDNILVSEIVAVSDKILKILDRL